MIRGTEIIDDNEKKESAVPYKCLEQTLRMDGLDVLHGIAKLGRLSDITMALKHVHPSNITPS
jgi:hypothetical protein